MAHKKLGAGKMGRREELHQDRSFPGGEVAKNLPANAGDTRDTGSIPGSGRFPGVPWNRKWHPTPIFLPGKFHGQRNLAAIVHGITKSRTQLSTHSHC